MTKPFLQIFFFFLIVSLTAEDGAERLQNATHALVIA